MHINSYAKLIEVLTLQKQNLGTYQTEVGATAQDITDVVDELTNLNAVVSYADIVNADKQTVFQIKQAMYNGDPDEALAAFPVFPTAPSLSNPSAGSLTLTNDRNKRFKAAPGYNDEIGEALGIAGGGGEAPDPGSVVPTIEASAAQTGYLFSVVVANRAESDSWQVWVAPAGTTDWQIAATATGKSTDVVYSGGTGAPVQLQVRVQLRKSNANYGQLSTISLVTVNP